MNGDIHTQELTSQDGTRFTAYTSQAHQPGGIGMVILPGGRGLLPTYVALADRFATAGIQAIAIDHFGRTAGLGLRDENFDFAPHLRQTSPKNTASDVAAAIQYLRSSDGGSAKAIFTIGFSFGGAASILQAAENHGLAGVIGFYGWPTAPDKDFQQWPAPITQVGEFKVPVLAIFGGADARIPSEQVAQFQEALDKTKVQHRVVVVPGADHGFFERRASEFPEQAAQAWAEVMAHLATYVPLVTNVVPKQSGIIQARHGEDGHFTGSAWLAELQTAQQAGANIYRVFFEPGARTAWHRHSLGQVLSVITGRGRVGNEKGAQDVEAGDLIYTQPHERHWHGAAPDSLIVHLAINPVVANTEWEEQITDDEYVNKDEQTL